MKRGQTKEIGTLTVVGSGAAATPEGKVAIVLHTKEQGPIAFEVDQRAIDTLRRDLTAAEQFLHQPAGKA